MNVPTPQSRTYRERGRSSRTSGPRWTSPVETRQDRTRGAKSEKGSRVRGVDESFVQVPHTQVPCLTLSLGDWKCTGNYLHFGGTLKVGVKEKWDPTITTVRVKGFLLSLRVPPVSLGRSLLPLD